LTVIETTMARPLAARGCQSTPEVRNTTAPREAPKDARFRTTNRRTRAASAAAPAVRARKVQFRFQR
jgi:hypothetical protein